MCRRYYSLYDFIGIEEQEDATFKERIEVMEKYKEILGDRLK